MRNMTDHTDLDRYHVKIVRPCANCGHTDSTGCPVCRGTGLAEVELPFAGLVKAVLADVFAKPQIEHLNADIKILAHTRDTLRESRDGFEKSAHNLTEEVERLRGVIERMEKKASE